jgi:hypothetical protein
MFRNKYNYLYLTGGLGNQLFQISAALAVDPKNELVLDITNGNPRVGSNGKPDVLDLFPPNNFRCTSKKMPWITKKAIGFTLRSHVAPRILEKFRVSQFMTKLATSVLVSLHYRNIVSLRVAKNLGYDADFSTSRKNNFLLGYFQSYKWAQIAERHEKWNLAIQEPIAEIEILKKIAFDEHPLVVHVRLGDYVAEKGFGVLSKDYYRKTISSALQSNRYGAIWLFSDEPTKAMEFLPPDLDVLTRVIDEVNSSAAQTLEVMRLGKGYIVGNSTFSWWGAFTSYNTGSPTFYPIPWFRDVAEPLELIPPNWKGFDANFKIP